MIWPRSTGSGSPSWTSPAFAAPLQPLVARSVFYSLFETFRQMKYTSPQTNATLLIRQHVLTPSTAEPVLDDLFRALHQMCTYHMEVLPLASGRSGAVSGQASHNAANISVCAKSSLLGGATCGPWDATGWRQVAQSELGAAVQTYRRGSGVFRAGDGSGCSVGGGTIE
jgi:hypothetical protein